MGGGLELSIKFPHQGDRDRVMEAGRRVGWSPDDHEGMEEMVDEEGMFITKSCVIRVGLSLLFKLYY